MKRFKYLALYLAHLNKEMGIKRGSETLVQFKKDLDALTDKVMSGKDPVETSMKIMSIKDE